MPRHCRSSVEFDEARDFRMQKPLHTDEFDVFSNQWRDAQPRQASNNSAPRALQSSSTEAATRWKRWRPSGGAWRSSYHPRMKMPPVGAAGVERKANPSLRRTGPQSSRVRQSGQPKSKVVFADPSWRDKGEGQRGTPHLRGTKGDTPPY